MRTIIVGTDFSNSSANACNYAAMLATKFRCKLTLFNIFEAPLIHSNIGLYGLSYTAIRKSGENKLNELKVSLQVKFPKLKIELFLSSGNFKHELENFTSKHQVTFAVMGMETKNWLIKSIYGSHGVNVAGRIETPVIIIPKSYKMHQISNILLAVDNREKLHKTSLKGFEKLLKESKLKLKVIHIRTPDEFLPPVTSKLKLNGHEYAIKEIKSKNIKSGIKEFCKEEPHDLVAVISKKHAPFYNLYAESNTTKVAYSTHIPVMAIHE